ncbi:mycofactocin system GMC family oxidoreductase MftG [Rhodococcus sp. NPDC058521]|uniref:mycofactocin dehydrogenase MftG n=1 Tax=Rhodococcus sp. NPDC058521 TaxID=3346536 RepID=UPI0036611CC1
MDRVADVVVVGGGSSGSVVAARLSEDPAMSVVLLESGPGYGSIEDCPVRDATVLQVGPESPWASHYPVELTAGNRAVAVRGRVLGGSGAVNGGYFVRARKEDFAAWPASWSYTDVLPYFVRSERDLDFTGPEHGAAGPVPVARRSASALSDVSSAFVDGAVETGYRVEEDKNADGVAGVGPVPLNITGTTRVSTAIAYLIPALSRSNLDVVSEATVNRVIVNGAKVSGVEMIRHGERTTVHAERVALAAGPIDTPLLLMRSGIGDSKELSEQGIATIVDIPGVGRSASDHPEVLIPIHTFAHTARPDGCPALEVVLNTANIEIRPYTTGFDRLIPGSEAVGRYIGVGLMHVESRGNIRMVSQDPRGAPRIEYHYLESVGDRAALRRGVAEAKRLLESPSMRAVLEAPRVEATDEWVLQHLATSSHLSSTCRMGADADPTAVVDDRCRVKGVDGLFVADSSVMPCVPSRGPHATTVMIAERVADFLRD